MKETRVNMINNSKILAHLLLIMVFMMVSICSDIYRNKNKCMSGSVEKQIYVCMHLS